MCVGLGAGLAIHANKETDNCDIILSSAVISHSDVGVAGVGDTTLLLCLIRGCTLLYRRIFNSKS